MDIFQPWACPHLILNPNCFTQQTPSQIACMCTNVLGIKVLPTPYSLSQDRCYQKPLSLFLPAVSISVIVVLLRHRSFLLVKVKLVGLLTLSIGLTQFLSPPLNV